jgi:hypothetical protein
MVKAWAKVTNSGSTTLVDDFNIGSVTDVFAGQTRLNFATNMANTTYSAIASIGYNAGNQTIVVDEGSQLVGSITIKTYDTGAYTDMDIYAIVIGNQ